MRVLSLFSGIGAFEKALDRQGINYELVGFSEIDKYAVDSYCAIHKVDKSKNLGDITKIDGQALPKDIDLITYGFPCQDISLAGKQKGLFNEDGSQTRSGLFFEALRIIEDTQPRVAIAENVKNLTGKTFKTQFEIVLKSLEEAGYNNYWKVLNAKDFGVPQNRERVFIVSIRKDIDTGNFTFPEGFPLRSRLKDVLEKNVDEKFYISDERVKQLVRIKCDYKRDSVHQVGNIVHTGNFNNPQRGRIYSDTGLSPALNTVGGGGLEPKIVVNEAPKKGYATTSTAVEPICLNSKGGRGGVAGLQPSLSDRVYDSNSIAVAVTTSPFFMPNYTEEPKIERVDIPQIVRVRKYPVDTGKLCECLREHKYKLGLTNGGLAEALGVPLTLVEHWFRKDDCFAIPNPEIWHQLKSLLGIETDEFDESIMIFEERDGVFEKSQRCYGVDGISPTITRTSADEKIVDDLRIRKLTPRECFRLMDFDDDDFDDCLEAGMSNAQLYKQAGNSIVVACPFYIMKELVRAGIFDYDCLWGKGIWSSAEKIDTPQPEDLEVKVMEEKSESSDNPKPVEYIFNQYKLIDLLLREGVISIKGSD